MTKLASHAVMACDQVSICKNAAPTPSEIVTSTMSRTPSMRRNVISASRHAVAAFSILTEA